MHIGSRVINISSRLGSISDNESGDDYGYRMSKAAQKQRSNLAIELSKEGICVMAMHPGIVATKMTGNQGTPADEVAGDLKRTIGGLDITRSGSFLDRFGEEIPVVCYVNTRPSSGTAISRIVTNSMTNAKGIAPRKI